MKLKRIGVLSLGYALAILYGLIGIVQGVMTAASVSIPALSQQIDPAILSALSGKGWLLVLIFPIIFAILGFIIGVIAAAAYNWIIVKITGGVKLEFEDHERKK